MKPTKLKPLFTLAFLLLGTWNLIAQDEFNRIDGQIEITEELSIASERIIIKPLTKKVIVEAAVYETVKEKVLVKEACTEFVVTPAVYETVEEYVKVQEATSILREVPAVYETMTERIMVAPESGKWVTTYEQGICCIGSYERGGCPTTRWEKVPAQYKTITKKVLRTPCASYASEIPPVYETIEKQVLKTHEKVEEVLIPAEYELVERQRLVSPAYERTVFDFAILSPEIVKDLGFEEASTIIIEMKPAVYKNEKLLSPALIKIESPNKDQALSKQISFYEVIPAVYETMEEPVLVQPESGKWVVKHFEGPCLCSMNTREDGKCPIVAWETIPAQYETVKKQVLISPTIFRAIKGLEE